MRLETEAQRRHFLVTSLTAVLGREASFLSDAARAKIVASYSTQIGVTYGLPPRAIIHSGHITRLLEYMAISKGYTVAELRGDSRNQPLVRRRMETYWLLTKEFGLSPTRVGKIMGKDHTTILHGLKKLSDLRDCGEWTPPVLPTSEITKS